MRIKPLQTSLKISNLPLYLAVLVQQSFIYFPMLSSNYRPRRWNDDLVLFNEYDLDRSVENFWPEDGSQFIDRIRGRRYLTIFSRDVYETFNRSQELTHFFFVICWFLSCMVFCSITLKLFSPKIAMISSLIYGSMPFRFEFFGYLQGVGYILVIFAFLICLRLVLTMVETHKLSKYYALGAIVFVLNYSSFLLYEVSILATPVLAYVLLQKSKALGRKFLLPSRLVAATITISSLWHILIVSTANNPIWNRSGTTDFSITNLTQQLGGYYLRGARLFLEPTYDFLFGKEISDSIRNILMRDIKISVIFSSLILVLILYISFNTTKPQEIQTDHSLNQFKSKWSNFEITILSIGLIASSAVGFLTFSGQFPSRLSAIACIGFSLVFAVLLQKLKRSSIRFFKLGVYLCILLISIQTLTSVNGIQSMAKVTRFDLRIESEIMKYLRTQERIGLPLVINLPRPICQEVGWWKKYPSIWESNSGQLNIAENLGLINGEQGDFAQVTYIPRVMEWKNPYYDFTRMSHSCKIRDSLSEDFRETLKPVWDSEYPESTQIAFNKDLSVYSIRP
jgi:hypothetical protein